MDYAIYVTSTKFVIRNNCGRCNNFLIPLSGKNNYMLCSSLNIPGAVLHL